MTITGDYLFIGLLLFGIAIIVISARRPNLLLTLGNFCIWFFLAMWLFFGDSPPLGLDMDFAEILAYGFFIMPFVVILWHWDVEIKNEAGGSTYYSWGAKPKGKTIDKQEEYRKKLRRGTRR